MLFDTQTPETILTRHRTGSDNPLLGALGYNSDGSRNGWGTILSWIPGANIGTTAVAQQAAKGTDAAGEIGGYQKGNWDKTLLEAQIAATVIGGAGAGASAASGAIPSGAGGAAEGGTTAFSDASQGLTAPDGSAWAGNGNSWLSFLSKTAGQQGKSGSPLENLLSGADNNKYQFTPTSNLIQNYNG